MEKYGQLFESVFKRKLTDENAVGYLENITKEHPYFSVAQFYLLRLLEKDTNGYKKQARKTVALFNNSHWLNFQLIEAGYNTGVAETIVQSPILEPAPENFSNKTLTEEKIVEAPFAAMQPLPAEKAIETAAEQSIPALEIEAAATGTIVEETENKTTVDTNEPVETNAAEPAITEPIAEQSIPALETETAPSGITVEEIVAEENEKTTEVPPAEEKIEPIEETENKAAAETIEPAATDIAGPEEAPQEEIKPRQEPVATNEPLLFEPLHTTDYFASVGIRLSEEEKTSGKLGKQLKSFTEWLKTMKKVHATQLSGATAPAEVEAAGNESQIQKLAEKSNRENEVLTEAMAEVLQQQGRHEKAVEILEKLSLLNPSKSAYFAAKINQIKEK